MRGLGSPARVLAVAVLGVAFTSPEATAEPVAQVSPGSIVRWPGEDIESCAMGKRTWAPLEGACFYAIDLLRGEGGALELARRRGGQRESLSVRIGAYPYPVQELTLPKEQVDLSPEDLARVRRENADIAGLWGRTGARRFTLPLHPPLNPLSEGGRFGSRRIINGQPRSPHSGADYSAAAGEPVLAAGDGVVALVGDHFFAGQSVFVDHGDGLISMYFHLSRVDVKEGENVSRGQRLGAVGSTGRATGPHLHFGVRWHRARVDPALLLGDPAGLPRVP
ncbi:MAG: M23 family metallopeptidase [Acidobacteriota bacterium]|jgi:murein DD-endopeptidase MepM/ murein hydrolase activator NlpD